MTSLEDLRESELRTAEVYFTAGTRVLELGGGSGFQASLIAARGAEVTSIDVALPVDQRKFFPVQLYDGQTIPFPDGTFDIVFSSNVLEHVANLDGMMKEMHRVLKPGGLAIHILPTPAWRLWTSLAHYAYLIMRLFGSRRGVWGGHVPSLREKMGRSGLWGTMTRVIVAGPHGEYPSALSEMWYFSKRRWLGVFRRNGFRLECGYPSGVFDTGYSIWPSLSVGVRRKLAILFGSATYIYVLRKA